MNTEKFDSFFQGRAREFLLKTISLALDEDGPDLTSEGLFQADDRLTARITAKQESIVAGLPIGPLVLETLGAVSGRDFTFTGLVDEGAWVRMNTAVVEIEGQASLLLKAERVILNFITHLSGVANLTSLYVRAVQGTGVKVLDTRKTLPGLRYPEKYAVLLGGGANHRKNLYEMLMAKDNHIDRAGGIARSVEALRAKYSPCPPVEVECRDLDEVSQAVQAGVDRIMLDNMDINEIKKALKLIPENIESEVSGGVGLEGIAELAGLGPDFISVGRLTHSAPSADFSMQMIQGRRI